MTITVERCEELRREIKPLAEKVGQLRKEPFPNPIAGEEIAAAGEAVANITLAYRHLEDASMRLGKAIQALSGGVSIYDKTQVPA